MTHPELQAEQAYIDNAYERVDELKAAARAAMEDVLDLGKGGTFQAWTERDVVVRTSLARLDQLDIGAQPLCFGRIDEVQGQTYYIGRMGVSGRDQEPLVVDWRAPVAEPFYRGTGRFPMGLTRRRHFELQGRNLVGIEDEPLVLGDDGGDIAITGQGALLAALERSGRAACKTSLRRFKVSKTKSFVPRCLAYWLCKAGRVRARPLSRCIARPTCFTHIVFRSNARVCWLSGQTRSFCVTSATCCLRLAKAA